MSGTWTWTDAQDKTHCIRMIGGVDSVRLLYSVSVGGGPSTDIDETVPLARVPRHYGGHATYFLCPKCHTRVRFLYGAGARFLCRHCHDLVNASSRESVIDRKCRKIRKLRKSLGGDVAFESYIPRPKGMHQRTFKRVLDEINALEDEVMTEMYGRLTRLESCLKSTGKCFW